MRFPTGWPDFTREQRTRLKRCGLCAEQVHALRHLLPRIRAHLRTPAHNDVKMLLDEIAMLSHRLSDKLAALLNTPDMAHADAFKLIEQGYWTRRPDDTGGMVPVHLCPRLHALEEAAREARDKLPRMPVRRQTADPVPIQWIENALRSGWIKRHGSNTTGLSWCDPDDDPDEILRARIAERLSRLKPAGSRKKPSPFADVVATVYQAAGYARRPKRALEQHVAARNRVRAEVLDAVNLALSEAKADAAGPSPGTSQKK